MNKMFKKARSFNQDIGILGVYVTNTNGMFEFAVAFNQDIGN
jgi:hypothetical protein